jgi:hypothetical protein
VGYASFLMTASGSAARDRLPIPLLSMGTGGVVVAYSMSGVFALAAVWTAKGYRGGYWYGLLGQAMLICSAGAFAVAFYQIRLLPWVPEEDRGRLLPLSIVAAAVCLWLVYQFRRYCRRAVRSWFERVGQLRKPAPDADLFRGRGLSFK